MTMKAVRRRCGPGLAALFVLAGCATPMRPPSHDLDALRRQVEATERAFARSMAERDLAAFERHLSEQAMFYAGPSGEPLRGRAAVVAGWRRFFDGPQAPFSWAPDRVDVLDDGTLAHSSGLVRDPSGVAVGRFNSVWRQEAPGVWRVVFDKGSPLTDAERATAKP